ncbi:MAG: AraC family transcriptional regulator [Pseudomonadota bacterium]|nr:AraC family transcriptional regulator [Pseudomonadota bacterium]
MHVTSQLDTPQVRVFDFRCCAEPHEAPFPEVHDSHSLSFVRQGSFGYHLRGRSFDLVAGSFLIGRQGDEFICTHDHHAGGDRCLSFHLAPELVDELGDRSVMWRTGALPPLAEMVVLGELAQCAAEGLTSVSVDEVGMLIGRRFVELVGGKKMSGTAPSARERQRAIRGAAWIEAHAHEPIDLVGAATEAGLSPFHFLRVFRRVTGVTPHQYLLRIRMRRAARLLTEQERPVTDVAYEAGFADLSNFVRTFHRAAGLSPSAFRACAHGKRNFLQVGRDPAAQH